MPQYPLAFLWGRMIRFQYRMPDDADGPLRQFSIEGDNTRGYVLLAWGDKPPIEEEDPTFVQLWFETLGEALSHCVNDYGIMKDSWHAPTAALPQTNFSRPDRGRRNRESNLLNPSARTEPAPPPDAKPEDE